jgi:hypothetical protein
MPPTGFAYIPGLAPFTDKRIVVGPGTAKIAAAPPAASVPSAITGTVMTDDFVGNNKAMKLQTKPFDAFGTVYGFYPVKDKRD